MNATAIQATVATAVEPIIVIILPHLKLIVALMYGNSMHKRVYNHQNYNVYQKVKVEDQNMQIGNVCVFLWV